ncbi:MAG: Ig-like domain-containing protein [Candidatus Marinimicrobia bacterium]|nr:Ig-like domain-containing protein [Candidatus Neomarinimicrobiota bacterium]MBL7011161.1 Ig-like domain-containing protein [Candidatus Neomarinimicrobiota bacterium]MBL7031315.1 Ig-like domain-containing protein [Candidatus Neomarinimicrobiota bacterium]
MIKSLKLRLAVPAVFLYAVIWFSNIIGCDDTIITPEEIINPYAVAVEITPSDLTIISGEIFFLEVIVAYSDSSIDADLPIKWNVKDSSVLSIDDSGMVLGLQNGKTIVTATYEDISDEAHINVIDKRRTWGEAKLENQTDQNAIMISWLPLGEKQPEYRERERYIITDSLGAFAYPMLADGAWEFTAEYPYFSFVRDTITFKDGKPIDGTYKSLYLNQELSFEVVLEKTVFTLTDSIWVTFKATNLTDDTLYLLTAGGPIFHYGFAITKNAEPLWYYSLNYSGGSSFDGATFMPGETKLVDSRTSYWPRYDMVIDLKLLNKYNYVKVGESYNIYGAYIAEVNYPINFFNRETYEKRILNNSLYKKLAPKIIKVEE